MLPLIDIDNLKSIWAQRIQFQIWRNACIGHYTKLEWKTTQQFHEFKCKKYGLVVDYPYRHNDTLICHKYVKDKQK
jgi:hypothetical protein